MKIENVDLTPAIAKRIKKAAWALPILYLVFFVMGFPFTDVSTGHTGINLFYGKPIGMRSAGWSFKMPLVNVVEIDNQAKNTVVEIELKDKDGKPQVDDKNVPLTNPDTESPTHDLQVAKIGLNSQWSILSAGSLDLYTLYGDEKSIEQALILPGLLEVQKALSAKYNAYDLQQKAPSIAEESKTAMTKWVEDSQKLRGMNNQIDIATVLYPHVVFSTDFANATRDQTTTEQSIGTFENNRTQAKTEAEATRDARIRSAKADAYQIRANADAESAGIIAKAAAIKQNPGMLCYLVHKLGRQASRYQQWPKPTSFPGRVQRAVTPNPGG